MHENAQPTTKDLKIVFVKICENEQQHKSKGNTKNDSLVVSSKLPLARFSDHRNAIAFQTKNNTAGNTFLQRCIDHLKAPIEKPEIKLIPSNAITMGQSEG